MFTEKNSVIVSHIIIIFLCKKLILLMLSISKEIWPNLLIIFLLYYTKVIIVYLPISFKRWKPIDDIDNHSSGFVT